MLTPLNAYARRERKKSNSHGTCVRLSDRSTSGILQGATLHASVTGCCSSSRAVQPSRCTDADRRSFDVRKTNDEWSSPILFRAHTASPKARRRHAYAARGTGGHRRVSRVRINLTLICRSRRSASRRTAFSTIDQAWKQLSECAAEHVPRDATYCFM